MRKQRSTGGSPLANCKFLLRMAICLLSGLVVVWLCQAAGPLQGESRSREVVPSSWLARLALNEAEDSDAPTASAASDETIPLSVSHEEVTGESEPAQQLPAPEPAQDPQEPSSDELAITVHTVRKGESLWAIAKDYGIDIDTIVGANKIRNLRYIKPGQKLRILSEKGVMHTIQRGQTLSGIASSFGVPVKEIAAANNVENPSFVSVGQELFIPGGKPWGAAGRFMWPIRGRLSSRFGFRKHPLGGGKLFHRGMDVRARWGTKVVAAQGGVVTSVGWNGSYGKMVEIKHQNGYSTIYGHNSSVLVRKGDCVKKGQVIARSGSTGRSTGPHLHFEVKKNKKPINPFSVLY